MTNVIAYNISFLFTLVALMLSASVVQNAYHFGKAIRRRQMEALFWLVLCAQGASVVAILTITLWGQGHPSYERASHLARFSVIVPLVLYAGLLWYRKHLKTKYPDVALAD